MRILFTVLLTMFLIACDAPAPVPVAEDEPASGVSLPAGYDKSEATIMATNLLADVSIVASDEFEGRGPGSEGDTRTRTFLATRLAETGFKPFF